jgi:geranylgeranyl pyrophosphate synthase
LSDVVGRPEREEIKGMLGAENDKGSLRRLREMLVGSDALSRTRAVATSYLSSAKQQLDGLADSVYKETLGRLADSIVQRSC